MEDKKSTNPIDKDTIQVVSRLQKQTTLLSWMVGLLVVASIFVLAGMPLVNGSKTTTEAVQPPDLNQDFDPSEYTIIDGVEQESGFIVDDHWEMTMLTCTACHSGKLVTQNNATREDWEKMIRWMQKTQGLWDLGEQEKPILDYLAKNYGITQSGRRPAAEISDWYEIQ
jgi:hypothetical protein